MDLNMFDGFQLQLLSFGSSNCLVFRQYEHLPIWLPRLFLISLICSTWILFFSHDPGLGLSTKLLYLTLVCVKVFIGNLSTFLLLLKAMVLKV